MDWIATQPSPTPSKQSNRFANFLSPLRKASSSHDLKQSHVYDDYAHPPYISSLERSTSPIHAETPPARSSLFTHSPPSGFGFVSNKTRLTRALAEGSGDRSDYVPYRGPISPPSSHSPSTFFHTKGDDRNLDQRLYLHLDRQFAPRDGEARSHKDARGPGVEVPRYRDVESTLLGLGLDTSDPSIEDSHPHVASSAAVKNRSLLEAGLPVAYTHGGNAPGPKDASTTPRSIANQSYLPSLLRFDSDSRASSSARPREIVFPSGSASTVRQSGPGWTRLPGSVAYSPPTTFAGLHKASYSNDQQSGTKAASITSSDDHGSSAANEVSASSSMTSFREHGSSIHSKARGSHEGPPLSSSAGQRRRANTSAPSSDKGKSRSDVRLPMPPSQQQQQPRTAVAHVKSVSGSSSVPFDGRSRNESSTKTSDAGEGVNSEIMSLRPLSPIAASTPGHQTNEHTPSQQHSTGRAASLPRHNAAQLTALRREQAHRSYQLLQQLHLDEMVSHAPDHSGVLEPSNGCERVLMPKPMLRERSDGSSNYQRPRSKSSAPNSVAFERNRHTHSDTVGHGQANLSDSVRAQEILSGNHVAGQARERGRSSTTTPLFHHRMPPPVPDNGAVWTKGRPPEIHIPPRRSSVRARHRIDATPALTPNLTSDDDDDDATTPDVATVLAQGRALDEERQQWREQYRRSMGKAKARNSGVTARRKVRYTQEPLPDLSTFHQLTGEASQRNERIRHAKSSPELRKKSVFDDSSRDGDNKGSTFGCFPLGANRGRDNTKQNLRRRAKSHENLRPGILNEIPCFPALTRRRRATTLSAAEVEKDQGWASSYGTNSTSQNTRLAPSPANVKTQFVYDEPVIITRQPQDKDQIASAQGANVVRFPLTQSEQTQKSGTYGIAFSAPRPDIGREAPQDQTFLAGRHATKLGYHRPTNSDDLRSMLSSSNIRGDATGFPTAEHQPVKAEMARRESPLVSESRRTSETSHSLMEGQQAASSQLQGGSVRSLPVPPRKQRSSHTISAQPSPLANQAEATPRRSAIPHFTTPFVANEEGFSQLDNFATPTLGTMGPGEEGQQGFFSADDDLRKREEDVTGGWLENLDSAVVDLSPSDGSPVEEAGKLHPDGTAAKSGPEGVRMQGHSTPSHSDDSSYSPGSVAARELWNTDEHPEESFSGLFFRRPSPSSNELLGRNIDMARQRSEGQENSQGTIHFSKLPQGKEAMSDSHRDSLYRSSVHARRDSLHVERLVGSYLNATSGDSVEDANSAEGLHEPAWNDSTTDLYRQEARIGRVGDHRPQISSGYRANTGTKIGVKGGKGCGSDEESGEEDGLQSAWGGPRGRLDSFAASLVLTEGGDMSPPKQARNLPAIPVSSDNAGVKHATASVNVNSRGPAGQSSTATTTADQRASDASLAQMVRDYVWPTQTVEPLPEQEE